MSTGRALASYKVLIFDVYGTLVDWECGIYSSLSPILPVSWSRENALLTYSRIEKEIQRKYPMMLYRDVLAKAHETFSAQLGEDGGFAQTKAEGVQSRGHEAFADSITSWPTFPDTISALRALSKHFKLVVLSNVDHQSFAATHSLLAGGPSEESKSPFTLILTAQDIGAYKPSLTCLQSALSLLETSPEFGNITADDVLVVAHSLYHDHVPANKLGLESVWIDRAGAIIGVEKDDRTSAKWGWRFATLGVMTEAVEKEVGGMYAASECRSVELSCAYI